MSIFKRPIVPELLDYVDLEWNRVTQDFENFNQKFTTQQMNRRELSFHDGVKLLGVLAHLTKDDAGPIIEIGVWKGKSLTLMQRLSHYFQLIIGIDPLELPGQKRDFYHFHQALFSSAKIIEQYSEVAVDKLSIFGHSCKLLHIDGGHKKENVLLDFLNYGAFVKKGGFIVFDDYADHLHSPEVKPAIEMLLQHGYFSSYEVLGQIWGFDNSFVIRKI